MLNGFSQSDNVEQITAEYTVETLDKLTTLIEIINDGPIQNEEGNAINKFKLIIQSECFVSQYIDPLIELATQSALTSLSLCFISGAAIQPHMHPDALSDLIEKLHSLTTLQSLHITSARLYANDAIRLIEALPGSVSRLNLSLNLIGIIDENDSDYKSFCKALVKSNITFLTFGRSEFSDAESKILAKYLCKMQRPFELKLVVGPELTSPGFLNLLNALHSNPLIKISLSDPLHFADNHPIIKNWPLQTAPASLLAQALQSFLSLDPIYEKLPTNMILNGECAKSWKKRFELLNINNDWRDGTLDAEEARENAFKVLKT